ncbi:hypothetical protein D3C85_1225400 [compost metagenome]
MIARGSTCCGSLASPAVTPMISIPPNANITTANEAIRPPMPLGMKPPWLQRLLMSVAWPGAELMPNHMMPKPPRIIATMAATLSSDNQNSISPKTLTLHRFRPPTMETTPSTQIQRETSGNQKPM